MDHVQKWFGDGAAIAVLAGSVTGHLTEIASLFTIVWMGLNIYLLIRDWHRHHGDGPPM
jgi:hypothetical protein